MSLSPTYSTTAAYASLNPGSGGGTAMKAIEAVPGKIADGVANGVADVGDAVGDAASATVSFSARAMQALAEGGMAVVHGVEDVIAFPFEMAADAAIGVGQAVEGGIHLVANGVANAAHALAIDLPKAIAQDMSDATQGALGDATTIAGAAVGVAALTGSSPAKVISAIV